MPLDLVLNQAMIWKRLRMCLIFFLRFVPIQKKKKKRKKNPIYVSRSGKKNVFLFLNYIDCNVSKLYKYIKFWRLDGYDFDGQTRLYAAPYARQNGHSRARAKAIGST